MNKTIPFKKVFLIIDILDYFVSFPNLNENINTID